MSNENCEVIDSIFEELCRRVSTNNEVDIISAEFARLTEDAERVKFAGDLLEKYSLFPKLSENGKNDDTSTAYRLQGNEAFKKKDSFIAWKMYTKSIAFATSTTDCLALAYANRSAVFFEKQLYKECLEDITNAFKKDYPKHLYEKLLQRETKARELLSKQGQDKYYERFTPLKQTNKAIQCANTNVEIKSNETLGRHVIASTEIELGDIIAVEKPYAQILLKEHLQDHCYYCLELCYNLLPCGSCVYAMYCSTKCQQLAWKQFHRYECVVMGTLYSLNASKFALLALRIAIMAKKHYNDIKNYTVDRSVYRSQSYQEIHLLATNTHLRRCSDLFPKATSAAIIEYVMKKGSSFHKGLQKPEQSGRIFAELIMRHLQTGPTNFHEVNEIAESDTGYSNTLEIGAAAYSFLSLFNHSCVPNVVRHCHGTEIIVRAIRPIPKGAEVLDNYGYHYAVTRKTERQMELRRQYYFDCVCLACSNDWPLYRQLPPTGIPLDLASFESLIEGNRQDAMRVLDHLLQANDMISAKYFSCPNKFIADLQETIKQCYSILGNRKPKVF